MDASREKMMNENFEQAWSDIRQRLMSGTLVRYWSAEGGYTGGAFRVDGVDGTSVIVRHGQAGQERRISKRDFQRFFAVWDAYSRGAIGRPEIARRSENAAYILGILQWHEEARIPAAPTLRISSVPVPLQSETVLATGLTGYDEYGKRVLYEATEGRAALHGPSVEIDYGAGPPAHIDATVGDIAIEIESIASDQVRAAILNLICHPYPRKLLVLLPDHLTGREIIAEQSRNILGRFYPEDGFRVLVLKGNAKTPRLTEDVAMTAAVLGDLRSA